MATATRGSIVAQNDNDADHRAWLPKAEKACGSLW